MENSKSSLPKAINNSVLEEEKYSVMDTMMNADREETWKRIFDSKDETGTSYSAMHNPEKGTFYTKTDSKFLYDVDGQARGLIDNDGNYKFDIPKEMDVTDAHVGPMVNKYLTEGDPVLGRYHNMPFPQGETEVG